MEELDIKLNFDQIKSHTKEAFKKLVKEHINVKAFDYLKNLQQTHSKARPLQYEKLMLQDYLKSENQMSIKEKTFTFAVRTRMINLKSNFKVGQKDLKCRLCDIHEEDQQGLLICTALNSEPTRTIPPYSDLFSEKKEKITKIDMILKDKFLNFQNILQVHGQRQAHQSQLCAASSLDINTVNPNDEDMG